MSRILLPLAALFLSAYAAPTSAPANRSVVIWHGLGDSFEAPGLIDLAAEIAAHRNALVHIISIGDNGSADRKASFFGNAREQVDLAAEQLRAIPELEAGYDAIGFSQGGPLLRSLAQSYSEPRMHTLITLGSPHMGVARLPPCREGDLICRASEWALRAGVWTGYAQSHVVPAQYFRDQEDIGTYLRNSGWLREVNNERWGDEQVGGSEDYLDNDDGEGADHSKRDATLRRNFAKLDRFVMFRFSEDKTISPPESAYFTLPNLTSTPVKPIPHSRLPLYRDDYTGLRTLDERGAVHYAVCEGEHMQIDEQCIADVLYYLEADLSKPKSTTPALVMQGV